MSRSTSLPHLKVVGPPLEPDEAQLVEGLKGCERWAQERAWGIYQARIHAILRRGLGPAHDVEDLVQEVFVRFFKGISTLRDPNALSGFIIAIAMNVMKSELRKRKVRRLFTFTPWEALPEQAVQPGQPSNLMLRRFYAMLDGLGSEERTIFVLRCLEGVEMDVIGAGLNLSRSTLRRRLDQVLDKVMRLVLNDSMLSDYVDQGLTDRWRRSHVEN